MDFRMRNFKENKQNYNSMVQFPKNNRDFSPLINTSDYSSPKIKQIEIRLNNLSESQRVDHENNGLLFARLEQRLDMIQRRGPSLDREGSRLYTKTEPRERNTVGGGQQLTFFKQGVMAELQAMKEDMRGQGMRGGQVEARQGRLEQELREWIGHQKQQISMKLLNQAEQIRGTDIGRQRKYDGQLDNLRAVFSSLQDDINNKMRVVAGLKQQMATGLQAVRDQSRGDKQALAKMVKEVKDSFQALRQALTKDRQYVKEAIFEIQSTSQDNFNKSCRSLEGFSQIFGQRQQKLDKRLTVLRDQWGAFKVSANQKIQDCKSLIVNVESNTLEQLDAIKNREGAAGIQALKQQLQEWKRLNQQKNLNVFREISNAMKVSRMEWRKQHDDLTKQQEDIAKTIKNIRHSLIDRIEKQLGTLTQLTNEQFDAFTNELEQTNDLIAISNKELKQAIAKSVTSMTEIIETKSIEAFKRAETVECTFNKVVAQTTGKLRLQIQQVQKAANGQIENLVNSIAEDNDQWEKDINSTITKLKQGCTQEIKLAIQNQSNKFTQEHKKVESSLEFFKKNIQAGLVSQRNEMAKQVSKVTEEITSLINDSIAKSKKDHQSSVNNIKDVLAQQKKTTDQNISDTKLAIEDLKKKSIQKANEDAKNSTELKMFVEQSLVKAAKTAQEEQGKTNKKFDSLKTELEGKIKASSQKMLLDINMKKDFQLKAKEEESKLKAAQIEKKIVDATAKVKTELQMEINKVVKNIEEESSKTNKKMDAATTTFKKDLQTQIDKDKKFCLDEIAKVKGEIQIKIKAKDEKNLSEINAKRDSELKQKDEQLKAKIAQIDKKIIDSSSKTKVEILGEVTKAKTAQLDELTKIKTDIQAKIKAFEQLKNRKEADSKAKEVELKEKQNQLKNKTLDQDKKIEALKKDIQSEAEKNKKYCLDQIIKIKTEIEGKNNAKKDLEAKQREDEAKAKMAQIDKKINETSAKTKSQILLEVTKSQAEFGKIKSQIQARMKAFEQLKNKKEADSKTKQNELKDKQGQLKAKSAELDKKIDIAKKQMTKFTTDEITKLKTQIDGKIVISNQQIDVKLKNASDSAAKGSTQQKAKLEELTVRMDSVKTDMDKRLAELKGLTLVNLKTHEQQANKLQDQKLQTLKAYFNQALQTSTSATAVAFKGVDERINKMGAESAIIREQMISTKEWLNKVEVNALSERGKNKAVYEKMTSDILDMADSITVMIAELKPNQK